MYLPLAIIDNAKEYLDCIIRDNIATDEFLRYTMPVDGPDIMKNFLKKDCESSKMVRSIFRKHSNDMTLINGTLQSLCNLHGWMFNKQVYRPDGEFLELLRESPLMEFNYKSLRNIPFKNMYIDISAASSIYHGAFVYIAEISDVTLVDIIIVAYNGHTQHASNLINHVSEDYRLAEPSKRPESKDILDIWQVILYLCADNSDVKEDNETKSTYRPTTTPKNKFSEIRRWNVGERIGTSVRIFKKAEEKKDISVKIYSNLVGVKRKGPRPHMRKAHWHRYMTGKGRTVPIIHWIAPTFIVSANIEDMPVTIHQVEI